MIVSLRGNQRSLHTRQNLFCLRQRQPQIGDLGKAGGSIDLYQVDIICRDVGACFDQSQNPTHARSPGQKDKDRRIAPGPIPPISGQSLVAFGGAGPLQGADVAAMLEIPEIIVPPYPGITSAMGLLTTDFKYDSVRTEFQVSSIVDIRKLNNNLNEMEVSLARQFDADRIPRADVEFIRTGDLRYVGQGYELRVPLPPGEITPENLPSVWAAFHARHAAEYGHAFEASLIEIVNVRVSGIGRMPKLKSLSAPVGGSFDKARIRKSPCLFRVDGKLQSFETTFYQRTLLPVEESFPGPAIVLQKDSTTLI